MQVGLTSKPHHAHRNFPGLRGSFRLRLASTFNHGRAEAAARLYPNPLCRSTEKASKVPSPRRIAPCPPQGDSRGVFHDVVTRARTFRPNPGPGLQSTPFIVYNVIWISIGSTAQAPCTGSVWRGWLRAVWILGSGTNEESRFISLVNHHLSFCPCVITFSLTF